MKATYIDHMGTDLSVVNAAKVSFGKRSEADGYSFVHGYGEGLGKQIPNLSKKDQGLIQFLARGCTSGDWYDTVRQAEVSGYNILNFEKHGDDSAAETEEGFLVGLLNHIRRMPSHWSPFAHTAISLHLKMPIFVARQIMKHTTGIEYNEVSRRYVDSDPEFYVPDVWRKKADNVKQGSSDEAVDYTGMPSNLPAQAMENMADIYQHMLDEGIAPEQARMVLPQSM